MAQPLQGDTGGISRLSQFLKEHGGAINYDLQTRRGLTRSDIGRNLSWGDFRDFVEWLPAAGDSAVWRSRKPNSWWITPEYVALKGVEHALALRMWQAAGGKKGGGPVPKPPTFPEDKDPTVKSQGDLKTKRRGQAEHLRRRRAERDKERR